MNKNYFSFLILKQSVIAEQASGYQNIVFSSVHILLSTVTNVILLYYSKHIQHPSARTWRIWGGGGGSVIHLSLHMYVTCKVITKPICNSTPWPGIFLRY